MLHRVDYDDSESLRLKYTYAKLASVRGVGCGRQTRSSTTTAALSGGSGTTSKSSARETEEHGLRTGVDLLLTPAHLHTLTSQLPSFITYFQILFEYYICRYLTRHCPRAPPTHSKAICSEDSGRRPPTETMQRALLLTGEQGRRGSESPSTAGRSTRWVACAAAMRLYWAWTC